MVKGYMTTKQLKERYHCSSRTIYRWSARDELPFPQPRIRAVGSYNLWAIDDVEEWEEQTAIKNSSHTCSEGDLEALQIN